MSFYIGRLGNKKNDLKYFKKYLPTNIKTVIEPFGGSYAVSRIHYDNPKYQKIISDADPDIYDLYINGQEFINEYNKLIDKNNKEKFTKLSLLEELKNNKYEKLLIDKCIIRGTITKLNKNYLTIPDTTNYIFLNKDYKELLEKYHADKNAFIFLDPPYLFSNNKQYHSQTNNSKDMDCSDIPIIILEYFRKKTTKCKFMLIINDIKILRYLFKDYIVDTYKIIYQISKKVDKHLVIINYKL